MIFVQGTTGKMLICVDESSYISCSWFEYVNEDNYTSEDNMYVSFHIQAITTALHNLFA